MSPFRMKHIRARARCDVRVKGQVTNYFLLVSCQGIFPWQQIMGNRHDLSLKSTKVSKGCETMSPYPNCMPGLAILQEPPPPLKSYAKFFRYKCRFQTYRAIFLSRTTYQVRGKTIRSRKTFNSVFVTRLLNDISTDYTFHMRERERERERRERETHTHTHTETDRERKIAKSREIRVKNGIWHTSEADNFTEENKMKNFVFSDHFHQIIYIIPAPSTPAPRSPSPLPPPRHLYPRPSPPPPLSPPTAPFTPVPPAPCQPAQFVMIRHDPWSGNGQECYAYP